MEAPVVGAIIGSSITVAGSWIVGALVVSFKLGDLSRKVDLAKKASDGMVNSQAEMSVKLTHASLTCDNLTKSQAEITKKVGEMAERVSRIEGLLNGQRYQP